MKLFTEYRGLRKELYILFFGRVMTNLGSMIWPMFTLIMNRKLGVDASTIAACMVVYNLVGFPVSLLGGRLADHMNKKNIIVICDLVSIASYVYCSLVPLTLSSMVIFAAASLFQTIEWPAYDALVADFTTSANRERAYSLSYLGSNLGLVIAPTLGGFLLNEHLNLAFFINGAAIAMSTVLIFFRIRDVHREEDDSEQSVYETAIDDRVSGFSYVLRNRVILMFILARAVGELVYSMYNYLMPLDMSAAHGDSGAALFGTMSSMNCIVVVTCTALITRLFRKMRDSSKMMTGQMLELVGYFIFMFLMRKIPFCYASIIVFTFGEIFTTLSASPFLTRRIPASHRGRILSVMSVSTGLLCSGASLLIGTLYDSAGSRITWSFVLLLGIVAMALIGVMKKFDRADYPMLANTAGSNDTKTAKSEQETQG